MAVGDTGRPTPRVGRGRSVATRRLHGPPANRHRDPVQGQRRTPADTAAEPAPRAAETTARVPGVCRRTGADRLSLSDSVYLSVCMYVKYLNMF